MRTALILMTMTAGTASLVAQPTWGGLRFGMGMADVRNAIKDAKNIAAPASTGICPLCLLDAPVEVLKRKGTARMIFDEGGLTRVHLIFDPEDNKRCSEVSVEQSVKSELFQRELIDLLNGKYGRPASDERSADLIGSRTGARYGTRDVLWKDGGQTVKYSASGLCPAGAIISVTYSPGGKEPINLQP